MVMRLRTGKPLPRSFAKHPRIRGLRHEHDICMTRGSRLRAKLLVFRTRADLRHFWRECLGKYDLGRYCAGAVNSLIQEVEYVGKVGDRHLEADPITRFLFRRYQRLK